MRTGGIGGSLFLIALGAILYWAVTAEAEGVDINTIGLILLVVGIVGLVLTVVLTASETHSSQARAGGVTLVERERPARDVTIVKRDQTPEDDR